MTYLLTLTQAGTLVGSVLGFRMWGSFLGNVPRLSFSGQAKVRIASAEADSDGETPLPDEFMAALARNFRPT